MEPVLSLAGERGLPDLTVVEFAVLIALLQLGPSTLVQLRATVADWFGQELTPLALSPAVRRLRHQGMLIEHADGRLQTVAHAGPPVAACFAAAIRITGTEFRRLLISDPARVSTKLKPAQRSRETVSCTGKSVRAVGTGSASRASKGGAPPSAQHAPAQGVRAQRSAAARSRARRAAPAENSPSGGGTAPEPS